MQRTCRSNPSGAWLSRAVRNRTERVGHGGLASAARSGRSCTRANWALRLGTSCSPMPAATTHERTTPGWLWHSINSMQPIRVYVSCCVDKAWWLDIPISTTCRSRQKRAKAVTALGARDDLQRLWQSADVLVMSSTFGEAFPNVVAEAMACGLPCVVTDVGDAAEIVGDTGKVVPPSDPPALAAAMLSLCKLPHAERQRLGIVARQRVLERYTLTRMAAGFQRVWDDVIAEERARCVD